jgi:hypothetical protein
MTRRRPLPSKDGTRRSNGHVNGADGHTNHTNGHADLSATVALPLRTVVRRRAGTVYDGDKGDGRDQGGRFTKGCKGGPGNPAYRLCSERRQRFLSAVSNEDIDAVAARLKAEALGGNIDAMRLLLLYSVGRPLPAADPDRADLDELQLRLAWPAVVEVLFAALDGMEPQAALEFIRAAAVRKQPGIDRPIDVGRAALLDELRKATVAARAGKK